MQKIALCALFLAFSEYLSTRAYATSDCVHILHAGNENICLKTYQETSPSLAIQMTDGRFYAAMTTLPMGKLKIKYNTDTYSVFNYDEYYDDNYELIHWLSGEDELVNGIWMDRLGPTTTDTGPLNFINYGCTWNNEHTGYHSSNGYKQFFETSITPTLNFGTDWYCEITYDIEPRKPFYGSTINYIIINLGGIGYVSGDRCGNSLETLADHLYCELKPYNESQHLKTPHPDRSYPQFEFNTITTTRFGVSQYNSNQSVGYIISDNNIYYNETFDTRIWNNWASRFKLFEGDHQSSWNDIEFHGSGTIYDIKIWRRKEN